MRCSLFFFFPLFLFGCLKPLTDTTLFHVCAFTSDNPSTAPFMSQLRKAKNEDVCSQHKVSLTLSFLGDNPPAQHPSQPFPPARVAPGIAHLHPLPTGVPPGLPLSPSFSQGVGFSLPLTGDKLLGPRAGLQPLWPPAPPAVAASQLSWASRTPPGGSSTAKWTQIQNRGNFPYFLFCTLSSSYRRLLCSHRCVCMFLCSCWCAAPASPGLVCPEGLCFSKQTWFLQLTFCPLLYPPKPMLFSI